VRDLGPHRPNGGAKIRPFDPHQECQRLCGLSLSGELSEEQAQWLDEHLHACIACRMALEEYEQLVDSVMPEFPAEAGEDRIEVEPSSNWSLEDAERRLFAALPSHPPSAVPEHVAQSKPSLWAAIGGYCIAAGLLLAVLALGYELGHRSAPTFASQKSVSSSSTSSLTQGTAKFEMKEPQPSKNFESLDREIATLKDQVQSLFSNISQLQAQRSLLESKLADQSQKLDRSTHSQDELTARLTEAESDRQGLEIQLASAEADKSRESADASRLRGQLAELNGTLQSRETDISQDQEFLKRDRDIRNLITARDLYITDVYDVAKTGTTQKPFGRIFYTKGRSLVFYGYDLDQQHGVRNASTFQAWGRHGADTQHDVSLGIMYLDDSNQNRWVLKFNDAATLSKIDAVFVTVEPRGPSSKPTGTPLLFASLRIDPNHP
jgi:hypothetical protein